MYASLVRASAPWAIATASLQFVPPAAAVPILTLTGDRGVLSVQGHFDGQPGSWSDSYDGPVFGGVALQIEPIVEDEFGRPNSFTVFARVSNPSGPSSIGAFTVIEPRFTNTFLHVGRADVEVNWRFVIGDEPATFSASASGYGGSFAQAGFTLFDETDDVLVASLSEGAGGSASGALLSNHEYTMNFFSHSETDGFGDPFGGFEFTTNATIVPEPATSVALLVIAALRGRRRNASPRSPRAPVLTNDARDAFP